MDDLLEALQFAEARLEELGEHELVGKCAAALAKYKAEQEPVAEVIEPCEVEGIVIPCIDTKLDVGTTLYAAPVRTKDLTDDEIWSKGSQVRLTGGDIKKGLINYARAVIAAYKEKNK